MKTKIFVDGDCIVCDMEIAHYHRVAPGQFELVDISGPEFRAEDHGFTPEDVRKNLHVVTPAGEVLIGVDAFAHIWSRTKKYQFAAKLVRLPVANSVAKAGYMAFTYVRPLLPRRQR